MKIRLGLVSNSSSSNFILALKKKPKSAKELQKLMFGDKSMHCSGDLSAPTDKIAEAVFSQLVKPAIFEEVLEELSNDYYEDYPDGLFRDKTRFANYYEARDERAMQFALEEFNKWDFPKESIFYIVTFADENGPFETLCEHGDIFENINHYRVSHH